MLIGMAFNLERPARAPTWANLNRAERSPGPEQVKGKDGLPGGMPPIHALKNYTETTVGQGPSSRDQRFHKSEIRILMCSSSIPNYLPIIS
ncbi:hypothetical protein HZ326_2794 [Fusarium oxysporum f. sp. albedinis]|nr:hypothetical protein HZ326_2794 [Fusarium oxysporum f. sp. albedinis]